MVASCKSFHYLKGVLIVDNQGNVIRNSENVWIAWTTLLSPLAFESHVHEEKEYIIKYQTYLCVIVAQTNCIKIVKGQNK